MKNNKIAVLLLLGLLIIPASKIQAQDGSMDASSSTSVSSDDKYPLPPVRDPGIKPQFNSSVDANVGVRLGEDKAGLRMEGNSSTNQGSAEAKSDFEAKKKEILDRVLKMRTEAKVKLEAKAEERVKKLLANIFNMLGNQIDRLTKVDVRIGEKINAVKSEGVDVTLAQAQYVKAQTALAKAKVDVAATGALSVDQTTNGTSKEALRALVKTAEESIKAAGKEYMKILSMLPEKSAEAKVETKTNSSTSVNQ